jgi:hypothetical protein
MRLTKYLLALGTVLAGLAVVLWGTFTVYQWVLAGQSSDRFLTAPRYVVLGYGIFSISGSMPFALIAIKLCGRWGRSPNEMIGKLCLMWLSGCAIVGIAIFVATLPIHQGSVADRMTLALAGFALGGIFVGSRTASRLWASRERRADRAQMMADIQTQAHAAAAEREAWRKEHSEKLAVARERKDFKELVRLRDEATARAKEAQAQYQEAKRKSDEAKARYEALVGRAG